MALSPVGRRRLRIAGITIGIVVLAVAALGASLYFFGGMEPPSAEARAQYAQMVAAGQANPVEARFVIPIPGCVCHSSDPAQQVTHAGYRIAECSRCHERVGPPSR